MADVSDCQVVAEAGSTSSSDSSVVELLLYTRLGQRQSLGLLRIYSQEWRGCREG